MDEHTEQKPVAPSNAHPDWRGTVQQLLNRSGQRPGPGTPSTPRRSLLQTARGTGLWLRDVGLGASGYVLLAAVVTAGFTASFLGLHDFAVRHMGFSDHQSWLVPIAIDGADIGLAVGALRAAMNGRSSVLNRAMIVACTSLSSWINYTHISDQAGRLIASLLPILAVVLLESLMGEARAAYERRMGRPRPRLSLLRWVFDRAGTLAILRAYVLGQELPEQMQAAAESLQTPAVIAKPRGKHRNPRQPASRPKAAAAGSLTVPEPPQLGASNPDADVIDIELVRKYGEKSARAITIWLASIKARQELSLRKIDSMINANGTAKFAIKKYTEEYGDPRKAAVNE